MHVQTLKMKNERGQNGFIREYATIKQKSLGYARTQMYPNRMGKLPCNAKKNRYKDIVPYDYCRVMLPQLNGADGTPQAGSDYINASYLNAGTDERCTIIAAQGPLPNTVVDFWRMLWSHNIKVVIMAAREIEGGKKKCEKYWPNVGSPMMFDQIRVEQTATDTSNMPDFVIHELSISCQGIVRKIHHYQYVTWPDHGVPESPIAVMRMLASVRERQPLEDEWPIVIHCSAGCGRTGTLAAIDHVWGMLKEHVFEAQFSVYEIICEYRKRRQSIVQTADQYLYVYKAVLDLVKNILQGLDPLTAGAPGAQKYDVGFGRGKLKSMSKEQAMSFSNIQLPSVDAESRAARTNSAGNVDEDADTEVAPSSASSAASSRQSVPAAVPRYFVEQFGSAIEYPKRVGKPVGERAPEGFKLVF